jgi:photosystem II stability/assembly factor-like uncharacterized protein
MKSLLLTVLALAALASNLNGQWEIINEGYNFELVEFASDELGWMIYEDWILNKDTILKENTILKTTDGGETWIPDSWDLGGDMHVDIWQIDFISETVGWVRTSNADLYKTIDGGISWEKKWGKTGFHTQHFYASEEIVVVTNISGSSMWKSINGGDTWVDISPAPAERIWDTKLISFAGRDTGICLEGGMAWFSITYNGGRTWMKRTMPGYLEILESGFIDNNNGFFIALREEDDFYVICKTEDAFETWSVVSENQYPIHDCHFLNKDVCIAIMEDSIGCKTAKSYDGGKSWDDSESFTLPGQGLNHWRQYDMRFCNDSISIIYKIRRSNSDRDKVLFKSNDSGDSWSMLNLSYQFMDVCFLNKQKGFVVGGSENLYYESGHILGTMDGGLSWNFIKGRHLPLWSCNFVNDSTGFAEAFNIFNGYYEYYCTSLYKTTDGGERWDAYALAFNRYTEATFISEQIGFAKHESRIWMTKDGGSLWNMMDFHGDYTAYMDEFVITSIVSSDENTFWAIAGDGCIVRFTSEGDWETIKLGTDLPLVEIFFKNEIVGWISARRNAFATAYSLHEFKENYENALFKTEDGGESWVMTNNQYQFRDMYFRDMQHGWAVGADSLHHGVVLETNNGGEDWTVQMDSLKAPLNGISYKDGYVWAVGQNGLILRMKDTSYVSAIEQQHASNEGTRQFNLFPNPTNSLLNIETDIPGQFSIDILDLNGRILMRTISNGSGHLMDLSSLQAGIYLIVIRSNESILTRKIHKY